MPDSFPARHACPRRCGYTAIINLIFRDFKLRNLRICPRCGAVKDGDEPPLSPNTGDLPFRLQRPDQGRHHRVWHIIDKATDTLLGIVEQPNHEYKAIGWAVPVEDPDDPRVWTYQTDGPLDFFTACYQVSSRGREVVLREYNSGWDHRLWVEVPRPIKRPAGPYPREW